MHYPSIWSMPDEAVEDWQPEIASGSPTRRLTRITVEGNPRFNSTSPSMVASYPGSTATSARVLNAIPAVCAADPGVLSALDLSLPPQQPGAKSKTRRTKVVSTTNHTLLTAAPIAEIEYAALPVKAIFFCCAMLFRLDLIIGRSQCSWHLSLAGLRSTLARSEVVDGVDGKRF